MALNFINSTIYRLIRISLQFPSIFCFSLLNSYSRDVFYPIMVALGESFWCKQIHQRWNCIFLAISRCLPMLVDSAIFAFQNGRDETKEKIWIFLLVRLLKCINFCKPSTFMSLLSRFFLLFFPFNDMTFYLWCVQHKTALYVYWDFIYLCTYLFTPSPFKGICHCNKRFSVCVIVWMRNVVCVCFLHPILTEFQFHQTLPKIPFMLILSICAMSK